MQTAPTQVAGWGVDFTTSLKSALTLLLLAVPRVIGFIIVVLIGWFVASLFGRGTAALLRAIRVNEAAQRVGFGEFIQRMDPMSDTAGILGSVVKWVIRLVVLLVAFDILGLPAVSDVLRLFLLWLPNLIVALVILFIAALAADALANFVRGATTEARFSNPDTLATVARVAVWAFAIVIAVNQLGIAEALVNTLFMGTVAMLALAGGLAFGLGGRDLAAETLDSWRERGREAKEKVDRPGRSAGRIE